MKKKENTDFPLKASSDLRSYLQNRSWCSSFGLRRNPFILHVANDNGGERKVQRSEKQWRSEEGTGDWERLWKQDAILFSKIKFGFQSLIDLSLYHYFLFNGYQSLNLSIVFFWDFLHNLNVFVIFFFGFSSCFWVFITPFFIWKKRCSLPKLRC